MAAGVAVFVFSQNMQQNRQITYRMFSPTRLSSHQADFRSSFLATARFGVAGLGGWFGSSFCFFLVFVWGF